MCDISIFLIIRTQIFIVIFDLSHHYEEKPQGLLIQSLRSSLTPPVTTSGRAQNLIPGLLYSAATRWMFLINTFISFPLLKKFQWVPPADRKPLNDFIEYIFHEIKYTRILWKTSENSEFESIYWLLDFFCQLYISYFLTGAFHFKTVKCSASYTGTDYLHA